MTFTKKKLLLMGMLLLIVALAFSACTSAPEAPATPSAPPVPPVEVRELRMQTYMGDSSIFAKTFDQFAGDVIRQQTNGAIDIKLFPDNGLVPPKELLDGVRTGVLDLAHSSSGRDAGQIGPIGNVALGMPYMWHNIIEAGIIYYDLGVGDMLRKAYGEQGIYLIGRASGTGNDTRFWTKVPIRSLEDFQNVQLRISGGKPAAELFTKFGVAPVSMRMGEIYTSLATDVIDGASAGSTTSNEGRGFHEHTKYIIKPGYIRNYSTQMIASPEVWNSLTPQQQQIIEIAFEDWYRRSDQQERVAEGEAIARMQAAGMEVITLPEADVKQLVAAAQEVWDATAGDDPAAQAALKIIKDFLRGQGYIE